MLSKVQTALAKLLAPGEPLLAGVSGGPDSVALLDALVQLGHRPHVCHLNHRLRGVASDGDADFVRDLARRYELPCTVDSQSVTPDEDAARQARLAFFERVSVETKIQKIALAHTSDDQVETFLMRLFRGAGVPGLVGIWPERQVGGVRIIRPLLKVARPEILQYLSERGLVFREDASNADTRYTRNRIRHELLPLLEREYNPAIREVLSRTAEILRDEDFYLLHHVVRTFYMAACQKDVVNVKALVSYPPAVQRRVLRLWLGGEDELAGAQFSFDHIEGIRQIAQNDDPSGEMSLPDRWLVYREYDVLRKAPRDAVQAVQGRWAVALDGTTTIPELGVKLVVGESGERFDAEALGQELSVRTWNDGDHFQPLGMAHEKKLQDFFVDEKVPRIRRGRVPLLCAADGRIAWVVGQRIADPFKITSQTRQIWQARVEPL
jgi:tRNA(Ile)-lysidine synthase